MQRANRKQWLKVIEYAIVGFATWVNPSAGLLLFLLKLCFLVLEAVQPEESAEPNQSKQP